jgi:RND family efflux transporter MFP subunit
MQIEVLPRTQPGGHEPDVPTPPRKKFSRVKPIITALLVISLFAALIFTALRPRQAREREAVDAAERAQGVPTVLVTRAATKPARGDLLLPGSMQAMTETPIFARSEGYVRKRFVDIGDRVQEGQLLAVIEAPEVDRQVQQAQASVSRAEAALEQAKAALEQSNTQMNLAEVTAQRWTTLFGKRVVSRQEVDEKQAAYDARRADNKAAQASVSAANDVVAASRAELQRLMELKGFQELRAPFSGVITVRNTDMGALIRGGASEGRELFRLAQTGQLRIMINVPQVNVPAISVGDSASVTVDALPQRTFEGRIARTANALDPATRTLLTEVHVPNRDNVLLPGMYSHVTLAKARTAPAVTIPGETLVVRSDGPQVAVVQEDGKVHYQKVSLGRDFGDDIEVTAGLTGGESIVINPSDEVREGAVVKAREQAAPARKSK